MTIPRTRSWREAGKGVPLFVSLCFFTLSSSFPFDLSLCVSASPQVQAGQAMSDAVVLPSLWAAAAAAAAEERSGDTAGDVESIFSSVDVDADGVLEVAELKEVSLFLSLSLALALSLSHSLSVSLSLPDWRSYDSHGPLCPTPGTRGRTRREDQGDRRR